MKLVGIRPFFNIATDRKTGVTYILRKPTSSAQRAFNEVMAAKGDKDIILD